jgi:hypothetical protein
MLPARLKSCNGSPRGASDARAPAIVGDNDPNGLEAGHRHTIGRSTKHLDAPVKQMCHGMGELLVESRERTFPGDAGLWVPCRVQRLVELWAML